MKRHSKLFIYIAFILFWHGSLAQTQTFSSKIVVPPAVSTSEFTKNIHNSVSYQNGTMQFSINLFTVEVGNMKIPIDISYAASGVKYGQGSGEIGVSWTVSPNFRVTRTIADRPDEHYTRPSETVLNSYLNEPVKLARDQQLTQFTYEMPTNGGMTLLPSLTYLDSEYDLFDYSIPDYDGSFVIEDIANKTIMTADNTRIKFDYLKSGQDGITLVQLTDPKGNKIISGTDPENGQMLLESEWYGGNRASTAWPVTKIITADNNEVFFKYTYRPVSEFSYQQAAISVDETPDPNEFSGFHPTSVVNEPVTSTGFTDSYFMDQIRARNCSVKFYRHSNSNLIDSICLYDASNRRIKKAAFYRSNDLYVYLDSLRLTGEDDSDSKVYRFEYNRVGSSNVLPDIWGNLSGSGINSQKCFSDAFLDEWYYRHNGQGTLENAELDSDVHPVGSRSPAGSSAGSMKKVIFPTGGYIQYAYESNQYLVSPNGSAAGPGIRLSSKTEYDPVAKVSRTTSYIYGENGNGIGYIPIPLSKFNFASDKVNLYTDSRGTIPLYYAGRNRTYSNDPITDNDPFFTKYNIVSYPVVKEKTDSGSIVYYYENRTPIDWRHAFSTNTSHQSRVIVGTMSRQYPSGFIYTYNLWDKPMLKMQESLDKAGNVARREEYVYTRVKNKTLMGLKVRPFAYFKDGFYPDILYDGVIESVYDYSEYYISSGSVLLGEKKITEFSGSDPLQTVITYGYNQADQMTEEKTTTSDLTEKKNNYTYPNMLSGLTDAGQLTQDIIAMKNANLVDEWIESQTSITKNISGVNTNLTTGAAFRSFIPSTSKPRASYQFNTNAPATDFVPVKNTNGKVEIDSRYEKEVETTATDAYGNVTNTVPKDGITLSYIWGYNAIYPVAAVENAFNNEIAYTSFEVDVTGNWSVNSPQRVTPDAFTGKQAYELGNGILAKSGLDPAKTYILSFWAKPGANVTVTGTQSTIQGVSHNGWNYWQKSITGINQVIVNGSGQLDEVRLFPKGAQMSTFTYDPLIGMTSKCDAANQVSHFAYDMQGRLTAVLDADKNIIKQFCYAYYDQPGYCFKYFNVAKSGAFQRNNCGGGYVSGSEVVYTVPAGTYSSVISQVEADQQAQNDVNANGQAYANTHGTCLMVYANVSTSGTFTRNNCGAGFAGTSVTYAVAAGAYTSTTSQADADQQAQNDINANGQAYANANGSCIPIYYSVVKSGNFTRNNCGTGYLGSTVTYTVPAATYTSLINQADADQKALNDVDNNGQAYANTNGTCTKIYYNAYLQVPFVRNNCPAGQVGGTAYYSVSYGIYTSTISQADADQQAQSDVNANGQNYANTNGSCMTPTDLNITINNQFSASLSGAPFTLEILQNGSVVSVHNIQPNGTETFPYLHGTYQFRVTIPQEFYTGFTFLFGMDSPSGGNWSNNNTNVLTTGNVTLSAGVNYVFRTFNYDQ